MSTLREITDRALLNLGDPLKYRGFANQKVNSAQREIARRVLWGYTVRAGAVGSSGLVTFTPTIEWSRVTRIRPVRAGWAGAPDDWLGLERWAGEPLGFAGDPSQPNDVDGPAYTMGLGDGGAQVIRVVGATGRVAVEGYRMPPKLKDDADACLLGDAADDALVVFVRAKIAQHEDDPDMHSILMGEFDREVRLFASLARPVQDGTTQIGGMLDG